MQSNVPTTTLEKQCKCRPRDPQYYLKPFRLRVQKSSREWMKRVESKSDSQSWRAAHTMIFRSSARPPTNLAPATPALHYTFNVHITRMMFETEEVKLIPNIGLSEDRNNICTVFLRRHY